MGQGTGIPGSPVFPLIDSPLFQPAGPVSLRPPRILSWNPGVSRPSGTPGTALLPAVSGNCPHFPGVFCRADPGKRRQTGFPLRKATYDHRPERVSKCVILHPPASPPAFLPGCFQKPGERRFMIPSPAAARRKPRDISGHWGRQRPEGISHADFRRPRRRRAQAPVLLPGHPGHPPRVSRGLQRSPPPGPGHDAGKARRVRQERGAEQPRASRRHAFPAL